MLQRGVVAALVLFLSSCAVAKKKNVAQPKLALQNMQSDFTLFRQILEETHPGIWWYTSKDSMDAYFDQGRAMLQDSMTEQKFRLALSYVISKMRCGHTSVRASKAAALYTDTLRNRIFPLSFKIWPDTAVVTSNLLRRDTFLTRGVIVTAIDGRPMQQIVDSLFSYLSTDGYNLTHKYQTVSNRGTFGQLYMAVFGYKPRYTVQYLDTLGRRKTASMPVYIPVRDTSARNQQAPKITRRQRRSARLAGYRSLEKDTALSTAFMTLNTFTKNARLPRFFKSSFKQLNNEGTKNLVIDLRGNGGGSVTNSNLLTKYISDHNFKIADSLYALKRNDQFGELQDNRFLNWLFLVFMTRKKDDGLYHFRFFERKYFKPKKKGHFDGQVYVLSGGNTFSASTLFIKAVREQQNVVVVGEETGGAAYGNNAWLLPDVTLPLTGVRFRLPLFRLVVDRNEVKGIGVQPEVFAGPTVDAIRKNADFKMEKVIDLIKAQN